MDLKTYIQNAQKAIQEAVADLDPQPEEFELSIALNAQGQPSDFNDVILHRATIILPIGESVGGEKKHSHKKK